MRTPVRGWHMGCWGLSGQVGTSGPEQPCSPPRPSRLGYSAVRPAPSASVPRLPRSHVPHCRWWDLIFSTVHAALCIPLSQPVLTLGNFVQAKAAVVTQGHLCPSLRLLGPSLRLPGRAVTPLGPPPQDGALDSAHH